MVSMFKTWGWVFGLMLIPVQGANGQVAPAGARCVSLSGISACLEDVWSTGNNPAGLARTRIFTFATSLDRRYLIKELGYYSLALNYPVRNGGFGAAAFFSTFGTYIDQKVILAYGMSIGNAVTAGISLVYIYQKAGPETPSVHIGSYQFGTTVILSARTSLGFATFNPFQVYLKNQAGASLPSYFRLGLAYKYSSELTLYSELEKDLSYHPVVKIGGELNLGQRFFIMAGFRLFPFSWSFGAAVIKNRLRADIACSYHQYLGFTPAFSLQYTLKNEK